MLGQKLLNQRKNIRCTVGSMRKLDIHKLSVKSSSGFLLPFGSILHSCYFTPLSGFQFSISCVGLRSETSSFVMVNLTSTIESESGS